MAAGRSSRELRNELSWSHSRFGTFKECLRRYYYHYYGSWGGWAQDADPLIRRLYVLKNLKSRYLWAGIVVHDTVAGILERVRGGLPLSEPESAADGAVERMRGEFRESRSRAYLDNPRRSLGLVEHHYTEKIPDPEWKALAEMVHRSIGGFFAEPYLATLQKVPSEDWLALEDLQEFPVDGTRVYVKMDLAFRKPDGGVVILDWKTGRSRPRPEGLQLGTYALYGVERWGLAPEQMQVVVVNLSTRDVGSAGVTARQIDAARATIREGITAMCARLVDVENNVARIEDFPASPQARTCSRCPFREVCPEGREIEAPRVAGSGARSAGDQPAHSG
jgi:CRISPR/Cas system-associated exonuclease Cas4 (RecB family)